MIISSILKAKKSSQIFVISPDTKIADVMKELRSRDVGAMVIVDNDHPMLGLITDRDIMFALAEQGPEIASRPVHEFMIRDVKTCSSKDPITGVMALMTERKQRYIPVVDDGKLVGIVSLGDIVKRRLDEVQADADAMFNYIARTR